MEVQGRVQGVKWKAKRVSSNRVCQAEKNENAGTSRSSRQTTGDWVSWGSQEHKGGGNTQGRAGQKKTEQKYIRDREREGSKAVSERTTTSAGVVAGKLSQKV